MTPLPERREALLALAERCEKAAGPERDIDRAIWLVLCGPADRQSYEEGLQISEEEAGFRADYMSDGARYTASVDAAMTLVPEGWSRQLRDMDNGDCLAMLETDDDREAWARNPRWPLALCAAAIRARAGRTVSE